MNKTEERALREVRRYVTLKRAALSVPGAMGSMTAPDGTSVFDLYRQRARDAQAAKRAGEPHEATVVRPLTDLDPDMERRNDPRAPFSPDMGDLFTNDVAEALRIYTESWVLPLIDVLLGVDPDTGEPYTSARRRTADLEAMVR